MLHLPAFTLKVTNDNDTEEAIVKEARVQQHHEERPSQPPAKRMKTGKKTMAIDIIKFSFMTHRTCDGEVPQTLRSTLDKVGCLRAIPTVTRPQPPLLRRSLPPQTLSGKPPAVSLRVLYEASKANADRMLEEHKKNEEALEAKQKEADEMKPRNDAVEVPLVSDDAAAAESPLGPQPLGTCMNYLPT
ncbi:Uu.00g047260.m01.CDS01 [Anthostomella pinea]|uniref:Uu.00g047260.m01.CDS01 n=1 Tax=Anthostomella pinea TaxID=933095 RepID=A0AAI8YEQ2_9PEZI|nr:Uu.00g047260.m01.CDS01 [Anthostomella pinea]